MATLNIMIGTPGSGKTTYAKKYLISNNTKYLSSDQIRIEMFGFEDQNHNDDVFKKMQIDTLEALKNNIDVVYDATNLSRKYRSVIIKEAKRLHATVNAYLLCTPINIILERNLTRTERRLPWDKLIQMIKSIEVPMYYEKFDDIYLIDGGMYNDVYDYNFLIKSCEGYNQDNPYHTETLSAHITHVVKNVEEISKLLNLNDEAEILRQAARYHDFGKLYTRIFKEEKGHSVYYGHERISSYLYLCHVRKQNFVDELERVRLSDKNYKIAALILNHMRWYNADMRKIKLRFNDDNLYYLLELLHKADKLREEIVA